MPPTPRSIIWRMASAHSSASDATPEPCRSRRGPRCRPPRAASSGGWPRRTRRPVMPRQSRADRGEAPDAAHPAQHHLADGLGALVGRGQVDPTHLEGQQALVDDPGHWHAVTSTISAAGRHWPSSSTRRRRGVRSTFPSVHPSTQARTPADAARLASSALPSRGALGSRGRCGLPSRRQRRRRRVAPRMRSCWWPCLRW